MTCDILKTGSDGNCILLDRRFALDMGVPFKVIEPHIRTLELVFLTHVHSDHFSPSTLRRIHKERPAVRFVCPPWMASPLFQAGVAPRVIDVLDPDEWYDYGKGFSAMCREVPHDVLNCAWDLAFYGEGGKETGTVFYATDCGSLDGIEAPGRDLYLIEGNYEEAELHRRMAEKLARGEFAYESRVENTHLSVEQALGFLSENADEDSRYVLIHRHRE